MKPILITFFVLIILLLLAAIFNKNNNILYDSEGNKIYIGAYLSSSQTPKAGHQIQCTSITSGVGEFVWVTYFVFDDGNTFKLNQDSMNTSEWVVIE